MTDISRSDNGKKKARFCLYFFMIIGGVFSFILSACGGIRTDTQAEEEILEEEAMIYVSEWQQLDLGYGKEGYLSVCTLAGDNLYYSYNIRTEEGREEAYIGRINLVAPGEPEIKRQGEGSVFSLFTDSGQNLWCLRRVFPKEEGGQIKWLIEKGIPGEGDSVQMDVSGHLEGIMAVSDIVMDEKDYIYCLVGVVGNSELKVFNQDGACIQTVEQLNNVYSMDAWEGKGILLAGYIDYAHIFSLQTQTPVISEEIVNKTGLLKTAVQEDGSVLFVSGNSLMRLSEGRETEELANLTSCNIGIEHIEGMHALSDGKIAILLMDFSANQLEVVCLKKVPESEVQPKKRIRLGTVAEDAPLNAAVVEFNKKNTEYQIEIVNYNSEDFRNFGQDAAVGQAPDLIDLRNLEEKDLEVYLEKKILEDLTPYLNADEELDKEDFLQKFLECYTREGVLYTIPDSFRIKSLVGKSSEVGDDPGWTPQEFMDFAAAQPEESLLMQYENKAQIFHCLLEGQSDSFLDWEKGICYLDCEEFKRILEFSNQYPSDSPDLTYEQIPQLLRDGRLKLHTASIGGMLDMQMINQYFGEPVTYVGWPAAEGISGSYFEGSGLLFGISSSSEYKEAAWSFIRMWLGEEVQLRNAKSTGRLSTAFPSHRDALEAVLNASMEARYKEDENGERIEIPVYTVSYYTADGAALETAYYAATREEVDTMKELIFSITNSEVINQEIQNIIMEEAEAYFNGQKSLEEVVSIMQNRVQLYLDTGR